jgi:hypothetical protein
MAVEKAARGERWAPAAPRQPLSAIGVDDTHSSFLPASGSFFVQLPEVETKPHFSRLSLMPSYDDSNTLSIILTTIPSTTNYHFLTAHAHEEKRDDSFLFFLTLFSILPFFCLDRKMRGTWFGWWFG